MKREIKFRGKDKESGKWIYGAYHKHIDITPCPLGVVDEKHIHHLIIKDGFSDWNMPRGMDAIKVDSVTVGQFTGLKDKNGKDIYEGDILYSNGQNYDFIQVVEFHNTERTSGRGWIGVNHISIDRKTKEQTAIEQFSYFSTPCSCIVIGNIHDNPELLKGGNDVHF
ncbi:YopX family protein [Bacteroides sp.]|uniref:YopX family protein n=1 Tax=Bacteroides sp. TaxID=29523 RepID=UPI002A7FD6A8|nr:YopX family protein [Bacteroides sp.]